MAKMIPYTPYVTKTRHRKSPVYAVVTIPAAVRYPGVRKHRFSSSLSWFLDVIVSLGLGAVMLCFLALLLISL
ncbi:MAG: hypothetical protein E7459_06500 [Ruminococcaceae bacterium]|nr:hypothetical protein [Oscillospiraceae bacterium]